MVRVFPVYDSLKRDELWEQSVQIKYEDSSNLHHLNSQITTVCQRFGGHHSFGIFFNENPLEDSFSVILLEIVIVILISRFIRFLLKPLKQPRIVSDIIGGIMIGPSVLGRNKRFSSNIFPDNAQFIIRNIGVMGLMFFIFLSGVTLDLTLIRKIGKKHMCLSLVGMFSPLIVVGLVGWIIRPSMDSELAKVSGIGAVASDVAFTSYPVIYLILKELNLLSSEIGRMALSTAMLSDSLGIVAIVVFESVKQGEANDRGTFWYLMSAVILVAFILLPVRRLMIWIVKKTPEGKPVEQIFVIFVLLGVLLMGFITDMFGLAIGNGSLWLGLVIPDGPPLGATIVERSETIIHEIFLPFSFALVGLYTDVFAMVDYGWPRLSPLFAMVIVGYLSKIVAVLVVALYFKIPIKDSLTLSLITNLRGQLELLVFLHWVDKMIIGIPGFTMLVLLTLLITAMCTPLISILYNPTKPYMVNKRRTIQHSPAGKEFRIVVCLHNKENIGGLIELLEVSYPTTSSPFIIYALQLIELIGRATPVLIDHEQPEDDKKNSDYETIENAFRLYQEARKDCVKLHFFTAMTVKRTMYQDICKLALVNRASLIILPFAKGRLDTLAGTEIVCHGHGLQSITSNVIAHAPCSVGILVDKGYYAHNKPFQAKPLRQSSLHQQYVLLFLGGPDAREALALADRMVLNPNISLIVVRFLSHNNEGDDDREKKLDDGVVTSFWVKNETNDRVIYREVVVKNGVETLAAIRAFNNSANDLWIVGRKEGINPVILEGLSNWSEHIELGIIGDYISSDDFGSKASVLVVHQQIMRG